jgi:hypothetical protein
MNERIRELMIRSDYPAPELALRAQKFAQLIVRECVAICQDIDRDDRCGESGQWWEPKNKKNLFKLIKHVSV